MTPTETAAFLRRYNVWRRGNLEGMPQPDPREIGEAIDAAIAMIDRLEAAEADGLEQARLNGIGAERELALMAKLEAAEKEVEIEHMRLAACGVAALGYFEGCAEEYISASLNDVLALRAKIEAMEKQEPAMWVNSSNIISAKINRERGSIGDQHTCSETKTAYHDSPLYALPGAKGKEMTDIHDTADLVSKALRRAWQLGQTYWQQADSEYQSHWKKADATQATFDQLVEDTRAAILTSNSGTQPAPSVPDTYAAGIDAVAAMLQSKAAEYAKEHGHDDMGGLSFGPGMGGEIKMDYYTNLIELVDDVRAMLADAPEAKP